MSKVAIWLSFFIKTICILIFSLGFFEFPPTGLPENDVEKGEKVQMEATYDRLVFVVLDALRSDFVYGSNSQFKFLNRKIAERDNCIGFIAKAKAPTVTLPRLKALTSGSQPVFLDLILNFDEASISSGNSQTGVHQENWVGKLKEAGKRIKFYGDDTWIRMFPDAFEASVPVHSFFVTV